MKNLLGKISAALLFAGVLVVNYLAVVLPIGGVTTGEASEALPNLFTPAGITFSIWSLIYALLAAYTIYQFVPVKKSQQQREALLARVNTWFIVTSVANISWIFAWHYQVIWLSVLIMLVFLVSLIMLANVLRQVKLSKTESILVRLPFSVYFGWITVASIANITVFLVSLNWDGFGLAESFWTIVVLLVGATIGIWRMYKDKNVPYGLVFIWAYLGILYKHVSQAGFDQQYPGVIAVVTGCLLTLAIGVVFVYTVDAKKKR